MHSGSESLAGGFLEPVNPPEQIGGKVAAVALPQVKPHPSLPVTDHDSAVSHRNKLIMGLRLMA
jgi:hypothetical protein